MYYLTQLAVRLWLRIFLGLRIEGSRDVPMRGGVLLCSNHISNWDPVVLAACLSRPVSFLAKEELFRIRWLKPIITKLHAYPIKRGTADHQAMRTAVDVMKKGNLLVMFPEGTRKNHGSMVKIERGVGLLAIRANVIIVPANISGSYRFFGRLRVKFGEPFLLTVQDDPSSSNRLSVDEAVEMIATHMRQLSGEGLRN